MKKLMVILLALFVVCFMSCKEDTEVTVDGEDITEVIGEVEEEAVDEEIKEDGEEPVEAMQG